MIVACRIILIRRRRRRKFQTRT